VARCVALDAAAVIAYISSCSSWSAAAERLSSRCAGVAVPGMGSVTGESASSHARAIWLVFALSRKAAAVRTCWCAGSFQARRGR
jgi:hypothetical protein